jgi:hypothetical protein
MAIKKKIPTPIKTIIVANICEFYIQLFSRFHENEIESSWIEPSHAECDMALLWTGDDKLVIVPTPPDKNFISDLFNIFGFENTHVVSPANASESICEDIENDHEFFDFLVQVVKGSEVPQIISWGATKQFYNLLYRLEQAGGKFTAPEIPLQDDYWIVPYLDSKCGFREICTKLSRKISEIIIPPGLVCANIEMVTAIVKSGYLQNGGIVVKSNQGVGGYGTLLYRREKFRGSFNFEKNLYTCMKLMPIFFETTLIVERYIESHPWSAISSPSIQGVVHPSGDVEILTLAGQIVDQGGRYIGAIISPDLFRPLLDKKLRCIGYAVGQAAAKLGYRGVFNIDTILGNDGQVYCIEINARRTSVKYILDMVEILFGPNAISKSIITNERFASKILRNLTYSDVRSLLSEYLFPMRGKPVGVIITIPSSLAHYARIPQLGFVVIENSLFKVKGIYSTICKLLNNSSS